VNHVAVYSGTTEDRSTLLREVCGSWSRYRFWTWRHFAYVKFHTGPSANARRYNGFSEITFEARGTYILLNSKIQTLYFQILMNAVILVVTTSVLTLRDLTNVIAEMDTI